MKLIYLTILFAATCTAEYGQSLDDLPKLADNSTSASSGIAKYILPSLSYPHNALEPHISEEIMKLHHGAHHQAYVDNLNAALEELRALEGKGMQEKGIREGLEETVKFNRGGHINHSLFWKGLAPANTPESSLQGDLEKVILEKWGSAEKFSEAFSGTILKKVRGSGWGWVVCNVDTRELSFETTRDQDPVALPQVVVLGIDMWEHAYYLQYYNNKKSYLKAIWNVLNWKEANERYVACLKHPKAS
ncbi:hypothetical protein H072_10581 [Dactylellina haptotyla CBS 200.50]|uniref:Superoxide dismutase n=1 Tax=Dactylellina haptotyla (strain CBS 200.50) TaxID=1284197 RepID=S7ZYW1_DACHA|nr:hypothetical protein H072_10581 [Dactylellina haptotyla CBS 200.50]